MDEIAKDRGLDPIAFRLTLAESAPRMQTLLRAVAEMSDWTRKRTGTALGVGTMVKDDTLAAGVAEVSVDRATGKIKVHNFWAAIDAGLAVQPRNIAAQMEGSVIYGLGHVLREIITIRIGRVVESNYTDYEVTRMSDVPNIEVRVVSTDIRRPAPAKTAAGFLGAVGNAIAALTGVRLHELPFAPERVRGAPGAPAGGGTRTFGAVARMSASDMREGQSRMTRSSGRASGIGLLTCLQSTLQPRGRIR